MRKKNVVFDLGQVLLRWEPLTHLRAFLGDEEKAQYVLKTVFEAPEWGELDRGTLGEEEALTRFLKRLPEDLHAQVSGFFRGILEILTPIQPHVDLLEPLRQAGVPLYILSNFSKYGFEYVSTKYDFFRHFDGGVISYEVKLLKPEREIYETLFERYGLKPAECVFFDDRPENIAAARELGMDGVVVTSQTNLRGELQSRGLLA